MKRILFVDDEEAMRNIMRELIPDIANNSSEAIEFDEAESGVDALEKISEHNYDLIITDMKMPKMDGMELLGKIKQKDPNQCVIMVTAHGTVELGVKAMQKGANDYLTKPFSTEEMVVKSLKSLELVRVITENKLLKETAVKQVNRIAGNSPEIKRVKDLIAKVAPFNSPVLVLGESGTGKELVAREIHSSSGRLNKPFIAINCAAIPENLLESELFGYERGAFTGAAAQKKGRFEIADGGTLFLDEIGELPIAIQVKLLRFLQEKEFERVGGNKTIKVDVRIICATNRILSEEIINKNFREDLYYRINVVQIYLPPLRERPTDIKELSVYFLEKYSRELHKPMTFSDDVLSYLMNYSWRGNIRELENVIERAVVLSEGHNITKDSLPKEIIGGELYAKAMPYNNEKFDLNKRIELFEREAIKKTLEDTSSNQTKTAQLLGLKRSSLQYKMKKYGLS